MRRASIPLYLHIAALAMALVAACLLLLRWSGGTLPAAPALALLLSALALLALLGARRIALALDLLAAQADDARRFDFSDRPQVRSHVREVDALGAAFDLMRDAIRKFLKVNRRLAGEQDLHAMLPWLLDKQVDIAGARGGLLYLADADHLQLTPMAIDTEGGRAHRADGMAALEIAALPPLLREACATLRPATGPLDAGELALLGVDASFRADHALALPLRDRGDQPLGLLLLFKPGHFDDTRIWFAEAVAASAAVSLETRRLIDGQKALLDATIRMVAGAIDAQSPYTGGHCERVPELALMLARAACEARDGPFAGFDLSPDQWEALRIAAWLHDCGKVATPEYVVDKATKLQTVHDRIHEVRTRFEVLKRDAELAYWRGLAAGGDEAALRTERDALLAALDEEFAFVARCNIGGEHLAPEDRQRLREIGARRWHRTLDNRLGLSRDELARMPPSPPLPVEEPLLADRPEHRIARGEGDRIAADNRWGFRMEVPELLYDLGELHNLGIGRGTLTPEERYKINEHMVQTIRMLGELPFPPHLREVPEIAGSHHEKLDGTGFPRRLDAARLGIPARIMAIADIFEALTAADRPYKSGKTLSESLAIMAGMRDARHIDAELFALFLRAGVHRDYAERFMRREQIDAVDIDDYL